MAHNFSISKININNKIQFQTSISIYSLCKDTPRYWNLEFKSLEFVLLILEIEIDF
ncbi:hypothetical protein AAFH68_02280 [Flavobacterium sp. CGRL1]